MLSDKKEALDVVEEKLTKVLNEVRIGTDFQNPILRLGKAGNTYGKILNSQALAAITAHHRVAAAGAGQLRTQIKAEESKLKSEINELAAKGQAIDLGEIASLAQREGDLAFIRGLDAILSDDASLAALEDARAVASWLTGEGQAVMRLMRATAAKPRLGDLARILELQRVLAGITRHSGRRPRGSRIFHWVCAAPSRRAGEFRSAIPRGKAARGWLSLYARTGAGDRSGAGASASVPISARSAQKGRNAGTGGGCPFIAAREFREIRDRGRASSLGLPTGDRQCRADDRSGAGDVEEGRAPAGHSYTGYGAKGSRHRG